MSTAGFGKQPVRVVSLAPNLTELVCDLGFSDCLVGRSSACDYPPEVKSVSVVGGFGRPNLELLASLRPDYVLVTDLENRELLSWLKQAHIQPLVLPCEDWDGIFTAAETLSAVFGDPSAGKAWKEQVVAGMDEIRRKTEAFYRNGRKHPRVYVEVWGDPLTTVGRNTFLDRVILLAGGRNIARSMGEGYLHVGGEWVVRENPDVIVLAYMLNDAGGARKAIFGRVGWSGIKAVHEDAVCDEIDPDLLLRPGPRLIDGAKQLAEWLMTYGGQDGESQ